MIRSQQFALQWTTVTTEVNYWLSSFKEMPNRVPCMISDMGFPPYSIGYSYRETDKIIKLYDEKEYCTYNQYGSYDSIIIYLYLFLTVNSHDGKQEFIMCFLWR